MNLNFVRKYYDLKVRKGSIVLASEDDGVCLFEVLKVDTTDPEARAVLYNMSKPDDFVYVKCFFGPLVGRSCYLRVVDRYRDEARVIRY